MKENYRVCLILPPHNPHSLCFREVGLLLVSALKSNGYPCDFTFNQLAQDRINIILGYHLLKWEEELKNYRYIPYQLEQLDSQEFSFSRNMEDVLRGGMDIWDYSEKNIAFLKEKGLSAKWLLPGYHENLEMINQNARQTIDVLFYGSIGERRQKILGPLNELCKLKALFGVYGEKRDQWIGRSKINLNLHHYSQQIFEAVRVSYLLNNGCFVLSEDSLHYCYERVEVTRVCYEEIINSCILWLNQPDHMKEIARQNYLDFKTHYPMTRLIQQVL